jgi:nitrite reductase/ring-hydroxylating ferredoxin subunit
MRKLFDLRALAPESSVRFPIDERREGFALRSGGGEICAFVNECPHRGNPVDQGDGKLFAADGTLECQAHGAYFEPASGKCLRGPCAGLSLERVEYELLLGAAWLKGHAPSQEAQLLDDDA